MICEVEKIFGKNDLCTKIIGELQKTIQWTVRDNQPESIIRTSTK